MSMMPSLPLSTIVNTVSYIGSFQLLKLSGIAISVSMALTRQRTFVRLRWILGVGSTAVTRCTPLPAAAITDPSAAARASAAVAAGSVIHDASAAVAGTFCVFAADTGPSYTADASDAVTDTSVVTNASTARVFHGHRYRSD